MINKIMVLDRRNENSSLEYGDFVTCCNCGRKMLVNIGVEKCPECDEKYLAWEDVDNKEVTEDFFYNNEDYMLVDTE